MTQPLPSEFPPGHIVEIYRNLRNGKWSVRHKGRVVAHCDWVELKDVTFVVRPGGKAKAMRTLQRNVHAFVKGTLIRMGSKHTLPKQFIPKDAAQEVSYNPFKSMGFFEVETKKEIKNTQQAKLCGKTVWIRS